MEGRRRSQNWRTGTAMALIERHERRNTYICLVESKDGSSQSTSHIALRSARLMEKAHLQGNSALHAEVECLQLSVSGPVPHMEGGAVLTCKQSRKTLADL